MSCGYSWRAPWISPPHMTREQKIDADYYDLHRSNEVCWLEKNHEGDHESIGMVTAENKKKAYIYKPWTFDPLIHSFRAVREATDWRKRNPNAKCECDPCLSLRREGGLSGDSR